MTLQTSGSISFSQIKTEFNLSGSVNLRSLLGFQFTRLPTSGSLSLSDFYGEAYRTRQPPADQVGTFGGRLGENHSNDFRFRDYGNGTGYVNWGNDINIDNVTFDTFTYNGITVPTYTVPSGTQAGWVYCRGSHRIANEYGIFRLRIEGTY